MDTRLQIKATPNSGNGVFATTGIPANTLVLETQNPQFSVIYRLYRKEACGYCFNYNQGRHWKVRSAEVGLVFCAEECRGKWEADIGVLGVRAYEAIEGLVRKYRVPRVEAEKEPSRKLEEVSLSIDDVCRAWADAVPAAERILTQRGMKPGARVKVKEIIPVAPDTLAFVLSGVLALQKAREVDHLASPQNDLDILYEASVPYSHKSDLAAHINSYLQLLEVVPAALLDLVTPRNIQRIAGLAYDNTFGIRSVDHLPGLDAPVDEDPGSELMGWALYAEASLFNHSCLPNVKKARDGRVWRFWTNRDIEVGEEVCITYLGGDERTLGLLSRQERLKLGWEFDCACQGCI